MAKKRITAHFQPQAWINDYAVDIDGAYDFDVTDQVLKMRKDHALEIEDHDDSSDNLWRDWVRNHPAQSHAGPFTVTVACSVRDFFRE